LPDDTGSVSRAICPRHNRGIAVARRFSASRLRQPREGLLRFRIADDGERITALEMQLVHFVAGANQNPRIARVNVRDDKGEAPKLDVEMRRDTEGVVLPTIHRQKRFPLLGSGRRNVAPFAGATTRSDSARASDANARSAKASATRRMEAGMISDSERRFVRSHLGKGACLAQFEFAGEREMEARAKLFGHPIHQV
jgi:hypothetical protein